MGYLRKPRLHPRKHAKAMAEEYNLGTDVEAFEELWGLTINASLLAKLNHESAIKEVVRLIGRLRVLVDRTPSDSTSIFSPRSAIDEDGMESVHVADASAKYVIFSDHHMLFDGARQNFFATSGTETSTRRCHLDLRGQ